VRGEEKRRVVRCPGCGLVQYWPDGKEKCSRCKRIVGWRLTARLEMKPEQPIREKAEPFPGQGFANRLKAVRKCRGLSQHEMARRLGRPRTWISKLENDMYTPFLGSLERICAVLEVTLAQMLDERLSPKDMTQKTQEELNSREAFMAEIQELLPQIKPHDRSVLLEMARGMAKVQYALPEWMTV
jgi:transcriptional regulator with XRE-family HTH domain